MIFRITAYAAMGGDFWGQGGHLPPPHNFWIAAYEPQHRTVALRRVGANTPASLTMTLSNSHVKRSIKTMSAMEMEISIEFMVLKL